MLPNPYVHTQCGKGAGCVSNPRKFLARSVLPAGGVTFAGQLAAEPGSGEGHLAISRCARQSEQFAGLLHGQTGEVVELDELRAEGVVSGQTVDGLVQDEQVVRQGRGSGLGVVEIDPIAPLGAFVSRVSGGRYR